MQSKLKPRIVALMVPLFAALVAMTYVDTTLAQQAAEPMAFMDHGVRMTYNAPLQAPTIRITARWGQASDALGAASSYRVQWRISRSDSAGVTTITRLIANLSDTMTVSRAIAPDSTLVRVTIWARRRALESTDSVYASRGFRRSDVAPPAPGPVLIDTGAVAVDSVAVFTAATAPLQSRTRDTTIACAYARAGGTWYRTAQAIMIQATEISQNLAQLDAYARNLPTAAYCSPALRGRLVVSSADSFLPVSWVADSVVNTASGDNEQAGFLAKIGGRRATTVRRDLARYGLRATN